MLSLIKNYFVNINQLHNIEIFLFMRNHGIPDRTDFPTQLYIILGK